MIHDYVNKLIENIPETFKKQDSPKVLDLVLEGGLFNGSFHIGALYFLKEMEKKKYIQIDRISGCSIGSLAGLGYFIDDLDTGIKLYDIIKDNLKKNHNLDYIKNIKDLLIDKIPDNILEKVNNKLFITYYNYKKGVKIVKSEYKNVDDIFNSIIKSCYVPFLIDGNILFKNKYFDGINPYIFEKVKNKQILYLELFGLDKILYFFTIKNEKNNFHRILSGLLDAHLFFIKQTNTQMCSYVNEWNYINKCSYYIKWLFEKIIVYIVCLFILINNTFSHKINHTIFYKIIVKITTDIFVIIMDNYCF